MILTGKNNIFCTLVFSRYFRGLTFLCNTIILAYKAIALPGKKWTYIKNYGILIHKTERLMGYSHFRHVWHIYRISQKCLINVSPTSDLQLSLDRTLCTLDPVLWVEVTRIMATAERAVPWIFCNSHSHLLQKLHWTAQGKFIRAQIKVNV